MLAPHYGEDAEFRVGWLAPQNLLKSGVFVGGQVVFGNQFRCYRGLLHLRNLKWNTENAASGAKDKKMRGPSNHAPNNRFSHSTTLMCIDQRLRKRPEKLPSRKRLSVLFIRRLRAKALTLPPMGKSQFRPGICGKPPVQGG